MSEDWREQLQKIKDILPDPDAVEGQTLCYASASPSEHKSIQKGRLDIIVERKGRGGKVATIVTGFTCGEDEVAEVAARLKQQLGTGGSARGGEILIQGDRPKDVLSKLTAMGYKARII